MASARRPEGHHIRLPTSDSPMCAFWITRGLGETGYDPERIAGGFYANMSDRMRSDSALQELVEPFEKRRRPTRPVVLVLTCLHEAYPFEPAFPTGTR